MKTALAIWGDRVAPVFDVAHQVHIVETEAGRVVEETRADLVDDPAGKTRRLAELGVGTLICGAISRPMQALVETQGIRVIPFVAGDLQEVVRAWVEDGLQGERFLMPGCRGHGRGWRRRRPRDPEEGIMRGRGPGGGRGQGGGQGMGGGRGQGGGRGLGRGGGGGQGGGRGQGGGPGQGAGGRRRAAGTESDGAAGRCLCPNCGYETAHEPGVPCLNLTCPQCGVPLVRR